MRTAVQDTSIESFLDHRASGKLQAQQREVMLALHNPRMLGDWSLQELSRYTSIAVHVLSARVNELIKLGYLERCERRKCSVTGKTIRGIRIK